MRIHRLIFREHLQRLGKPGLCGAALIVLAFAHAVLGLLPAWLALEQLSERTALQSAQLARIERGDEAPPVASGQQLDDFRRNLPAQLDATSTIDRIYALANGERLSLARGEYALGVDTRTRLARYQIVLPVRGSYPQLRRFLHALLAEVPALVLEDLDFQRKQISETELEGRIRLTLYLSR
ncbi:GspMb/PilO family protein [Zestomonas carbonaria]|uniref:Pilus assembly protein PilO n=1 Tax=Zestomonas carbonaria TaxID=2762745 RepID=A0A7U7IA14_9GAMM|nr:GspMb/PilO family protein [Pseudomonas carbonaria]CAD5108984.1 hypothetical protein PSEWESI4_03280 [Pseudomonas carbonaria]